MISGLAAIGQSRVVNGFTLPRLSPVPAQVQGVQQPVLSLDGEWRFAIKGRALANKIKVPGEWEMQGFHVEAGETAVYSKKLAIPSDWKGKQVYIRFDGVSSYALVKLNGRVLGEHEGSFVPFEVNLSPALREADNLLEVEVQSLTISDTLACTSQYAVHTVGGLLRKVRLFVLPEVNLSDLTVQTSFDAGYKNGKLSVQATIDGVAAAGQKLAVRYQLIDAAGKTATARTVNIRDATAPVDMTVKQVKPWNPESPVLYRLQVSLLINGQQVQQLQQRVGFRQVAIRGNQLLVNDQPVKLHGVNRHSIYPLTGRSIDAALDRKDAELFRAANCNYIRTSHYPPTEEFLDACDELGLFVESEASLCWIQHGASPIWRKMNYTDNRFLAFMQRANVDNVLAGKKHPSVILWSLGNESRWSPLWAQVNQLVKAVDPTRPTSFHDQCWGGFNNAGSEADIANYHYPGLNGPAATDTMKRPVLFGEYAHLTTYNRRELLTDPGVRSAYGAPLVKFYDSIYAHPGNLGGAIWSGIDDVFHLPDGRIVGYGPWGPLDAWRRPKPEYWGMKKAYSPVRVLGINWSTVKDGYIELTVENRYDFTSMKQVAIMAAVNGVQSPVTAAIAARTKGTLRIPARADAQSLQIRFTDPRGFVAEEERYERTKAAPVPAPAQVRVAYTETPASYHIQQGAIEYQVSKATGVITQVRKGETVVLQQGPVFCMVPMNSEDGGKPNVAGETYQNKIYPLQNFPLYILFATSTAIGQTTEGLRLEVQTTYTTGKGKQTYYFTTAGQLEVEYEVWLDGKDVQPYQYGLLLQLPRAFDRLSWKRAGEFSLYPATDIARNEGVATLNARPTTGVEEPGIVPAGDWKDDANELGSNDFRATKRSILTASLQDQQGNTVRVSSNGQQASRTWLQDQRIQWLIADYSNNGSEPFYGSPHTDGRITVKKNQPLKGKIILTIQ